VFSPPADAAAVPLGPNTDGASPTSDPPDRATELAVLRSYASAAVLSEIIDEPPADASASAPATTVSASCPADFWPRRPSPAAAAAPLSTWCRPSPIALCPHEPPADASASAPATTSPPSRPADFWQGRLSPSAAAAPLSPWSGPTPILLQLESPKLESPNSDGKRQPLRDRAGAARHRH
jgi:hypothetical protein